MPKRVAILLEKMYEDLELQYPKYRLREAGHEVHVVGPNTTDTFVGKHGYPQKADHVAAEVKAADYDLIVVPGGSSPDHMRRHEPMVRFVRDAVRLGKPIAAICHGTWMLCSTRALRGGRRCTSYMSIADDVRNAGGTWVDEACVVDGGIITSRTPDDLPAFMRAILSLLDTGRAEGTVGTPAAPKWVHEGA